MQNIKVEMDIDLAAGEEWFVQYQQVGDVLQTLIPNPITNPFYILNQDETACYQITVRKKCVDGSLGQPETIMLGVCGSLGVFSVENNGIDGVITGVTPAMFVIVTGGFPLNISETAIGSHGAYTGSITVNVTGLTSGHDIVVAVAGVPTSTTTAANGANVITGITFTDSETVLIQMVPNT